MSHHTLTLLCYICLFLFFICAVLHYSRRSVIPFVTWILFGGIGYGVLQKYSNIALPDVHIEPDIVFFVLLPILIFASAQHIQFQKLKTVGGEVAFFATVGVVAIACFIALPISWIFQIPFLDACLFGAIMSATDPVAVLSIFQRFPLPEKLKLLIEGESLLNDGTAVILFSLLSVSVLQDSPFAFGVGSFQVLWAFVGAIGFGAGTGYAAAKILSLWHENEDDFIEPTMTVITALLTFIIAEHFLHVSGVVAVMVAAMMFANTHHEESKTKNQKVENIGIRQQKKAHFSDHFWSFLDALANSLLFFLLGIEMGLHIYDIPLVTVPMAILILLVSRSVAIYAGSGLLRIFGKKIPLSAQHVLNVGGLKGALSVALLLLLPEDYEYKMLFLCMAFVMIVWTLLVNTTFLQWLLKKLKV